MEGQMFVISSIILLLAVFLLFSNIRFLEIVQKKRASEVEVLFSDEAIEIKKQLRRLATIDNNSSMQTFLSHMINFSDFVKRKFLEREKKIRIISIFSFNESKIVENAETILNVSIVNKFWESLENVSISFNSTTRNFPLLLENSITNTSFTFSTSQDLDTNLTFSFNSKSLTRATAIVPISIKINETLRVAWHEVLGD